MEFRTLKYFLTVAREENITRAAALLHLTQPTLSRQLMQLEEELGVKLFRRSQHHIVLTEAGMLLRRRAQEIVELADIHTRERQETRWRQNIHTGAAVCPAFIRKHWEVCCMKIMDKAAFEEQNVFGLGAPNDAFARYFAGRSYLNPLTRPEDGLFLANVTFEPGCRNNWHIHHASEGGGQLLICTAGEGWYQEEGKEAVSLEPGRVIVIPAEVKHWHGAKRDSWFSHIAVEMPGEACSNEWCEPVSDAEYEAL